MSIDRASLRALIDAELDIPVAPEIAGLADRIRAGRDAIVAVLFYGAGLWKPPESDTVFDFYVLVDRYRSFDSRLPHAMLGSLLPPNVYYLEAGGLGGKFAVIRAGQFARAAAGDGLNTQIWARFAQPCRLLYARDDAARESVLDALVEAVITFHAQTLPLLEPGERNARGLWTRGLDQTYGNEWRSESGDRASVIYAASQEALDARADLVLADCRPARRIATRGARRTLSKSVYFLQLMKAVFTFEGGVDYALWKIERQSGVRLHVSDFQRRHPLLSAWPLVWKAWRLGALR